MDKKYLIVNPGSASKKYALYQGDQIKLFAHFEKENDQYVVTLKTDKKNEKEIITTSAFANAANFFLEKLFDKKIITNKEEISAVGIRVVAPGTFFSTHRLIGKEYWQNLKIQQGSAPLHITPLLQEIENINKNLPQKKVIGISDSAFHSTAPKHTKYYAIPFSDSQELDLYRFGYHGISMQSLIPKVKKMFGKIPSRIIACHLGGGASITAIKDGKSLDNSMGYTPLEGLVMATRVGDIDSGAITKLACAKRMGCEELEEYLNTKSGLLGLSEDSSDMREILKQKNEQAKLALDTYIYRIQKYIGAYYATLNGLDLLIFTGTVGERSKEVRKLICKNLDGLGIKLDQTKNDQTDSVDKIVSKKDLPTTVAVITTNEMQSIARKTQELLD